MSVLTSAEIRIRDPFIHCENGSYYLVAAEAADPGKRSPGVQIYESDDLARWSRPRTVFTVPAEWGCSAVWAPELHRYGNAYYLFTTLNFDRTFPDGTPVLDGKTSRGTWVLKSKNLFGPYEPMRTRSHTPQEWLALDGTLYVENGVPYMVFCHEWCQVTDGTMEAVRLKDDLSGPDGEPFTLFRASAVSDTRDAFHIADGPFLYRGRLDGSLNMIWSTFMKRSGYCEVNTKSRGGTIEGPWDEHAVIFRENGGHGMIFTDKSGNRQLVIHQPNTQFDERLRIIPFNM